MVGESVVADYCGVDEEGEEGLLGGGVGGVEEGRAVVVADGGGGGTLGESERGACEEGEGDGDGGGKEFVGHGCFKISVGSSGLDVC